MADVAQTTGEVSFTYRLVSNELDLVKLESIFGTIVLDYRVYSLSEPDFFGCTLTQCKIWIKTEKGVT